MQLSPLAINMTVGVSAHPLPASYSAYTQLWPVSPPRAAHISNSISRPRISSTVVHFLHQCPHYYTLGKLHEKQIK